MPKDILLIQLKQLGDVLMCTPTFAALTAQYPEARLHLLTMAPADQLVAANPNIYKTWLFPKKARASAVLHLITQLREQRFELAVDFYNKPISAALSWLSGAKMRIGYNRQGRRWFYTHPVQPQPTSPYSAAERLALLEPLGIQAANPQLALPISPEDQAGARRILDSLDWDPHRPLITLSPVSRQPYKVWPAERFAQVANALVQDQKAQLLFLWGPGEAHFVEAVRSQLSQADLGDYPVPSLSETVGLLRLADFHLGNDNGPMHFAIATGCPSLAVFGRPLAENWMPPGSPRHRYVEWDPGCKRSCHYPKCQLECLQAPAELVLKGCRELLQKVGEGRRQELAALR
ncbi:MAG: glycosyltransferase family 9 protein [bacterium]|nr:glycosyltransferase family 9 protein [bacterium]